MSTKTTRRCNKELTIPEDKGNETFVTSGEAMSCLPRLDHGKDKYDSIVCEQSFPGCGISCVVRNRQSSRQRSQGPYARMALEEAPSFSRVLNKKAKF